MIEIALKPGGNDSGQTRLDWIETTPLIELHNINFNRTKLRIGGVIYTEKTEECIEAFNKAKFWAKLSE